MTWKVASDVVWVALAVLTCGLVAVARYSSRVMTFGQLMPRVLARPVARGAVLVAWMWLGWHSFAR
jgi:hypothetical protein